MIFHNVIYGEKNPKNPDVGAYVEVSLNTDNNKVEIVWSHPERYCKFRCYLENVNTFPMFVGKMEWSLRGVAPEYISNKIYATLRGELSEFLMDDPEDEETDEEYDVDEESEACDADCEHCMECEACEFNEECGKSYFDEDDYEENEEDDYMRSQDEIADYMGEAFDLVWLVRKQEMFRNIASGKEKLPPEDIMASCIRSIHEICKKYNIDFSKPVDDWNYGYWSGVLATLRWVCGEEKDTLDT